MQLFISDLNPYYSAIVLDDRRLYKASRHVKAILTMSGTYNGIHGWSQAHPSNTRWVIDYGASICGEIAHRFGKIHELTKLIRSIDKEIGAQEKPIRFPNMAKSPARQLDFTNLQLDVHDSYRAYLRARWLNDTEPPTWSGRELPHFLQDDYNPCHPAHKGAKHYFAYVAMGRIGSQDAGASGSIRCPRCGFWINWYCDDEKANFLSVHCETIDCIDHTEVPRS